MDFSAADTAKEIGNTMSNNSVLAARGIGKTVKSGDSDLVILRDIDLEITPGQALGVVGA
jgi:predicted ABC-type transport system involved in lysophospholipase L1 biosynthesis ATPase subunit